MTTPTPITPLVALFQAKGIRILGTVDEPIFCATDVAKHIEDTNSERVFEDMPEYYACWETLPNTLGIARKTRFLTEIGLYRYLLQSRKKLAEPFQKFTYDLLTAERKRTVDEVKLALKIEQSQCVELKREAATTFILARAEKVGHYDFTRAANIARDELKETEAQIEALSAEKEAIIAIKSKAAGMRVKNLRQKVAEYETCTGAAALIEEKEYKKDKASREDETSEKIRKANHEAKRELAEIEAEFENPLIALFQARNIRILGSVCEPLFCAADVAKYIEDDNSVRIFQKQTPEDYIRWETVRDSRGRMQKTRFLTESGLYRYLLQSTCEEAESFQLFTYSLLKETRRRTVDNIQLAAKIEQTKATKLQAIKDAARKERQNVQIEQNRYVSAANIARDKLKIARGQLKALQDNKALKSEREQIRHYWSPFTPPEQ